MPKTYSFKISSSVNLGKEIYFFGKKDDMLVTGSKREIYREIKSMFDDIRKFTDRAEINQIYFNVEPMGDDKIYLKKGMCSRIRKFANSLDRNLEEIDQNRNADESVLRLGFKQKYVEKDELRDCFMDQYPVISRLGSK